MNTCAGVPQGSVLGQLLWHTWYDGALSLELVVEAMCVGVAGGLGLAVDESALMTITDVCLDMISRSGA